VAVPQLEQPIVLCISIMNEKKKDLVSGAGLKSVGVRKLTAYEPWQIMEKTAGLLYGDIINTTQL